MPGYQIQWTVEKYFYFISSIFPSEAKDGVYWLKSGKKPAFKAFCDMTTDNGGWTLFYSYVHHPYEDYDLDGTVLIFLQALPKP